MRIILWFLNWLARCPSPGDHKYDLAMEESLEVLKWMNEAPDDPARAMMVDIWHHRHNAPYLSTLYEAWQEMNAPVKQRLN